MLATSIQSHIDGKQESETKARNIATAAAVAAAATIVAPTDLEAGAGENETAEGDEGVEGEELPSQGKSTTGGKYRVSPYGAAKASAKPKA
jgi:hypothetical protein